MKNRLTMATCQYPVSADIQKNASYVMNQMTAAKASGADISHFPESSLSGYAGIDFQQPEDRDDTLLMDSLEKVCRKAATLKIWTIVGGHQFEGRNKKPYNCLWIIDSRGQIAWRYDKRFCTGKANQLEHFYYRPGRKVVQFKIKGVSCGVLICHEWRYPELYREQNRLGTRILFQSWYDGNLSLADYQKEGRELGTLIPGTVRGSAANNQLWISASNTSARESCFASFVVRPDGQVVHKLKRNFSGVLITRINPDEVFADPSGPWRNRAVRGVLHSAP